jgi:hypothetical protein
MILFIFVTGFFSRAPTWFLLACRGKPDSDLGRVVRPALSA